MEKIIINENDLKEEDITEIVQRVKILLINSENEILLGYSHNEYQFPGGHVEENEKFIETIKREILEETGIQLNFQKAEPFACNLGYYKDWPEKEKNRKIEIYYYEIITNEKPNLDNVKLTENEKQGNFELRYISLDKIEEELKDNVNKYGDSKGITREILEVINIYKNRK